MLKISLAGMSEEQVERAVAERCSIYGTVKKLRIYLPRKDSVARPFALVDMATREEAERLADAIGRLALGSAVVVFLEQERDRMAVLIRAKFRANNSAVVPPLIID